MKNNSIYALESFNLGKKFLQKKGLFSKREIQALSAVTFTVSKESIFGILGVNGAGKTTLLRLLTGLIIPDKGNAFVNGYDLRKESNMIRRSVGVVFNNERSFYWRLSVKQNLEFFAGLYNVPKKEAERVIEELLILLDLVKDKDTWVEALSLGMKQRLSIARGLIADPDLVLMDEPTRGLDPFITRKIWNFIKDDLVAKRKKTVLICTNYLEEAEMLCDNIAILSKGKIAHLLAMRENKGNLSEIFKQVVGQ